MSLRAAYVGRIAPSPTGLLHLGHAATFWTAYRRALDAGGVLRLRNEDLDPQRARHDFAEAMVQDLAWLGIRWAQPVMVQSERLALYGVAFERLLALGAAYPCRCSRRELAGMISAPHEGQDDEPLYGGRCRPAPGARVSTLEDGVNYRFRVPDGEVVCFQDGNFGEQRFVAGQDFGDFLVWRRDGLPSYQLACVVDDAAMGVTEVVRGADLLKSTARQILLQRALGLPKVAYFHTALLRDEHGVRLAKRHDALSLKALRELGASPADVLALLDKRATADPLRG